MSGDTYHYSLIQYVGNSVRREALNLGVVAVGAEPKTGAHAEIDYPTVQRTSRHQPQLDTTAVQMFVRDLRAALAIPVQATLGERPLTNRPTVELLRALSASMRNEIGLRSPLATRRRP